jgi:hypothetical protein
LSYQGGSNNNPYSYNNGTGGRSNSGNDLFANVSGFLQSAVVAGNQFAEQAGNKLNEAKNQAQNDGWFDFDNLQAQASAFAENAKQKAQELAGGSSPPPGQRSSEPKYTQGFGGNFANEGYNYQPNSSSAAPQLVKPATSSVTASPAPSSSVSSAPPAAKKPLSLREKSPPRVDRKQANVSLNPPDLSKTKSEDKKDLWDTDAWFDEM